MNLPHKIAALAAVALVPVALVVPSAQADSTYTGALNDGDPLGTFLEPDPVTDQCIKPGGSSATARFDTVTFTSQSNGPRRIVLRDTSASPTGQLAIWAYRNGACVAADYLPDDAAESGQRIVDLDNVVFAEGDHVTIKFFAERPAGGSTPWRLDILQPGTANAAAAGKGSSYVKLPYQVSCGSGKAVAKVAGKAKARKIKSITFTAGGKKVAAVKGVRARQNIKLKGIPSSATSIKAVVKLKGGGKAKVTRAYSACR
ncbi:hypothetical protein F9L07_02085 [Pimelobacter simplex]|uniref:Uncharacterized protein n=1 Tax=Nocardioides simplex TaxID=2045 RepID=A0A7J5DXX3_NOCSI|nr:hypothetical protein [Pimelobacter simplex]KAB2810767.1 hypothetical protein F9L07_02085 [Pimelobacter simplex]